ncbi:arylamine N-acetyltransferase [Streptomyces sp. NBC_01754]|uniref:arylamine N-acetyltransferase family protein n=1 Tax=Streptomyces sp. NBC_01754 TaxID=2975930 RepID=UPI002DDC1C12|nr:arylamine N-acetyltransferase [Streptomyces sp. NBC_01754]WSC94542.1 arylamine N-acetyltransferase [Streptomyces sp. NBC_01754]
MTLDLDAYLARIGWSGERRPTAHVLRSVHRAQVTGIPFENLEPVLGGVPSLELHDLEAKLLRSERGGYCYEQNVLLAAALSRLGFGVTLLAARVVLGAAPGDVRPRTHMLLKVQAEDEPTPFVADAGFGASGALLEPIPLVVDAELSDAPRRHRLVHAPHDGPLELWELQAEKGGAWEPQYEFTLEPYEAPDFEVANWHVATNPRSPFRQAVYAQRTLPGVHKALSGRTLTLTADDGTIEEHELDGAADVVRVLAEDFGVRLPEGTALPG